MAVYMYSLNMNTVDIMHDVETLYWITSGLDCRIQISV